MSNYWADKRVVCAGGAGMLGSHLVKMLLDQGASVKVPRKCDFDLRYPEDAMEMMTAAGPIDVLFHLAANVGGIGYNQRLPATLLEDNAFMALNVLSAADWHKVGRTVVTASTCAYPERPTDYQDWRGFAEWDLFDGYPEETNAAYGVSKRLMIVYADALRRERGMDVLVAVPTNLFGPHDSFDPVKSHVIPALIRNFCSGDMTVWGSGKATRDFLYVEDAARGLLALGERGIVALPDNWKGVDRCVFNLGSNCETKIADVAEMIRDIVQPGADLKWDRSKPDGQPRRLLDTTKSQVYLRWQAKTSLKEGLEKTIAWYKAGQEKDELPEATWLLKYQ